MMFDGLTGRAQTPQEAVSLVRRHSSLIAAERAVKQLRSRNAEITSEIARLNGEKDDRNRQAVEQAILKLSAERDELARRFAPAVQSMLAERAPYLTRVADALAPFRTEAATRAIGAVDALLAEIEILDQCNAAIKSAAGEPTAHPDVKHELKHLAVRLRRNYLGGAS